MGLSKQGSAGLVLVHLVVCEELAVWLYCQRRLARPQLGVNCEQQTGPGEILEEVAFIGIVRSKSSTPCRFIDLFFDRAFDLFKSCLWIRAGPGDFLRHC